MNTQERIYFTEYKGTTILVENFSGLRPGDEFLQIIDIARKLIASQPEKSVLAVLDATGASFNSAILTAMKDFVKGNTPYIKAAAVVGVEGLLNVALTTLANFAGRSFKSYKTREEAMDWLLQQ